MRARRSGFWGAEGEAVIRPWQTAEAMKYNNIQPTARELAVIQVPSDGVNVDKSPLYTDNNEDDSDDFSPTPPLQPKKKHDANIESPIPHVSAIPQAKILLTAKIEIKETVLSIKNLADSKSDDLPALRQDLNSFKDCVMGEFTSLRSLINENFKKLSKHVKANQNTEKVSSLYLKLHCVSMFYPAIYIQQKKGKYNQSSRFKYTTVNYIFKTGIAKIFDKYNNTDNDASVANEEDVVCEYIRGYRLLANVPWHTVNNVLIPVNLKDKLHWILAVVSFKERCINVYDSYRSAGHDAYGSSEIDKLAKLVPLYLSISDFYIDKQGIDWSHEPTYNEKAQTEPFDVVFISNVPQQKAGSMDCELYVAAYAEYLSTYGLVPQTTFDANLFCQRYGALLWDYTMRNIDADAISDNETPTKIVRQIIDSDTSVKRFLE
nr:uncharacterized protein LOC104097036 [Nicotiana tomentosiformis]